MDEFVVSLKNAGQTFWLKGTTWSFHRERADTFKTREEASAAIEVAKKFMIYKRTHKNIAIEVKGWPQ